MKAEFDLRMANGARVRTLNGLLQHFDMRSVLEACRTGALAQWLASAGHPNRAQAVQHLDPDAPDAQSQLLGALDLDPFTSARILLGLNDPAIHERRAERLRELTDESEVLSSLDCCALSQKDLDKLAPLGLDQIFLCGDGRFMLSPDLGGVLYTGAGNPLVRFSRGPVAPGVDCERVRFDTTGFVRDNLLGVTLEAAPDYYFPQFWDNPELGIRFLRQAAVDGDSRAQALLAVCWLERFGTQDADYLPPMPGPGVWGRGEPHFKEWQEGSTQSHAKAAKWAQRSAGQEDPVGMLILAKCCRSGLGVPQDEAKARTLREKAVRILRAGAETGDPVCQFNLGQVILDGQIRREDLADGEDGQQWIMSAAHLGLARAQCEVADTCMHVTDGGEQDLEGALSWFQRAARQGDARGLSRLADFYYFGDGVEVDEGRAVEMYHTAAMRGNVHAQERLAECLECGFGLEPDPASAAYWRRRVDRHKQRFAYKYGWSGKWEQKEDRAVLLREFRLNQQGTRDGNLDAMHALAWNYLRGVGTKPDHERGLSLLEQAMQLGHVRSVHSLAQIHERGEFVSASVERAMRLYEIAAEQGDLESQMTLARRYSSGSSVPRDPEKAAYWLMQAAAQGDAEAELQLGVAYRLGAGVPRDERRAVSWLAKSAQRGNSEAQYTLGTILLAGDTVEADPEQAIYWLKEAAGNKNMDAQFVMGLVYSEGMGGVQEDPAEAARWYRLAAENGHARSQCNLGVLCYKGEGVEQSNEEAARWYRLAAEQGHPRSQYNLARLYEGGEGVEEDHEEAARWYRRSAEGGNPSAQCNLGCMYERGDGVEQDDAEAVRWFQAAASQGHARSQYNLGCMYEEGRGISRSRTEAFKWYREAANNGQVDAQRSLARCYRHGIGVIMSPKKAKHWEDLAASREDAD